MLTSQYLAHHQEAAVSFFFPIRNNICMSKIPFINIHSTDDFGQSIPFALNHRTASFSSSIIRQACPPRRFLCQGAKCLCSKSCPDRTWLMVLMMEFCREMTWPLLSETKDSQTSKTCAIFGKTESQSFI
jgi:hypothetical protein